MDAVVAPRPLTSHKERHVVEAIGRKRDAYMRYALGVIAQLESQTICAANEAVRSGHRHEALATKLRGLPRLAALSSISSHASLRLVADDLAGARRVDGHTCRAPSYVQRVLGGEPKSFVGLACDTH